MTPPSEPHATPSSMLRQFASWVAHHWRIKVEVSITDRTGAVEHFTYDYLHGTQK